MNTEKSITIRELAIQFGVSKRTIRYDLEKIEDYLELFDGIKLSKRPRIGIGVEYKSNDIKQKLLKEFRQLDGKKHILSLKERRQLIIIELLRKDTPITVKKLEKICGVSETTILKDLDNIEEWFRQRSLFLIRKRNYGIKVYGKEQELRKGICDILREIADFNQLFSFLEHVKDSMLLNDSNKYFNDLLGNTKLSDVEEIVKKAEELLGFKFADGAFAGLVIHIAISIKRLKEGKDIEIKESKLKEIQNRKEFQMAEKVAKMIEKNFHINVPVEEIGYLTLHLMGAKIRQQMIDMEENNINQDSQVKNLALEISSIAEGILNIPLTKDKQFIKGLILHLKPALYRLEFDLNFSNPLLQDIKKKYPHYYKVAKFAGQVLECEINKKITEDEIGFIALHIGAAVERNKPIEGRKVKVTLVCSSGIGTTSILATRLKQEFPYVNIVSISSAFDVEERAIEMKSDFIISTIPINMDGVPVVVVNPLLEEQDIKKLKNALPLNNKLVDIKSNKNENIEGLVNSIYEIIENYAFVIDKNSLKIQLTDLFSTLGIEKKFKLKPEENLYGIKELLTEDFIELGLSASSWEDAVKQTGTILCRNRTIKEDYIEAMIKVIKEQGPYIVISEGVALLHARPSDGVQKLSVSLGVFPKGVEFGHPKRDPVYLVFAFSSVDSKSHLRVLKELMKIIIDRNSVEEIRFSNSVDNVLEIINQIIKS